MLEQKHGDIINTYETECSARKCGGEHKQTAKRDVPAAEDMVASWLLWWW